MRSTPVLLVLCFLYSSSLLLCQTPDRNVRPIAGIVNGDTVWLDQYSREVGRRAELSKDVHTLSQSDIIEQSWQEIVQMLLFRQEAKRRGIDVTRQEVDSILLRATPDFVKQGVVDDKGRFDARLLHAMATNPDSLIAARAPNMKADAQKKQAAQLKGSMDELRGRIAYITLVDRLKQQVTSSFKVDSTKLHDRFIELATTAVAEMIYMPCPSIESLPTEAEIEAYHKAHSDKYFSAKEMRRLAILKWPLVAAHLDSVQVLKNTVAWVADINKANSKAKKDTLWNSVASTVASGITTLHPDSTAHQVFYNECKSKKPGTAVGPILHTSGVHVLFIDSLITVKGRKDKIYSIRVVITDITPSKQTVDSTFAEVQTAADMYDGGTMLGDIATKFNKQIDISPFFGKGDKIYDSYRLVDAAFETQLGAACPAVVLPDHGAIVGVVIDSIPPGPLPAEAVLEQIVAEMQVELSCKSIEKTVKSYAGIVTMLEGGTMMIPESPKGSTILRDVTVTMDGYIGENIVDPFAGRVICSIVRPGLMDAFRGDAGWYIVNVKSVQHPTAEDYPLYLLANGEMLTGEQRNDYWDAWANENMRKAQIQDFRWQYFRY